ncbi:MAG: cyclic pyranopterin monophosphate synthase MoaC [Planctomycetota bacterium]
MANETQAEQSGGADPRGLVHLDARGAAWMVDVGGKPVTERTARARAEVELGEELLETFFGGGLRKGDGPAVARIAGIQAAKETARLIPLCHPVPLTAVQVDVERGAEPGIVEIRSTARTVGVTGVEMEALTAVSVAALAVYDMCKSVQRGIRIRVVELVEKTGGVRGDWRRATPPPASAE